MYLWSYYCICWGDPGSLEKFYKDCKIFDQIEKGFVPPPLDVLPRCKKCGLPKPERCHHCSICNKCYFRFDHHCPIVGNCIGFYNLKAFILFQIYGGPALESLFITVSAAYVWVLLIPLSVIPIFLFIISTIPLPNIFRNETTLEEIGDFTNEQVQKYDRGCYQNFIEVFGPPWMWLLPIKPAINGFHWCGFIIETQMEDYYKNAHRNLKHL